MSHQRRTQTKSASLIGLERWAESGIGPEGMESNHVNEYLFQLWVQNQVWFLGPPTQHVMEQSPALKKEAPCPAELEAELVLSFLSHSLCAACSWQSGA